MKKLFTILMLTVSFNMASQTGNTYYGSSAFEDNYSGDYNSAFGYQSMQGNNISGDHNTALGVSSLRFLTSGQYNTALGSFSLYNNTTGSWNVGVGYYSLFTNTAYGNTAVGYYSLKENTTGMYNVSIGHSSLTDNTTGEKNTSYGAFSLYKNTTGIYNSAGGYASLNKNTTGNFNSAFGSHSLYDNTTGAYNTAIGYLSLGNNTTGQYNTALGKNALDNITTGGSNTAIGYSTDASSSAAINQTIIGYEADGQADNSVVLGNSDVTAIYMAEDSGATIYAGNATFNGDVVIQSDTRLKSNIVSLGSTLPKLLQIDGKSYEKDGKQKIGVLAQEVREVFPELVSEGDNEMLAVNYQGLVPVLINALKEQQSEIETYRDEVSELKEMVQKLIKTE